jgi:hypothetical protein
MRWRVAGCCALALLALTGCFETYRRGGRADRAAHKDAKGLIPERFCSNDDYELFCEGKEESQECLDACG